MYKAFSASEFIINPSSFESFRTKIKKKTRTVVNKLQLNSDKIACLHFDKKKSELKSTLLSHIDVGNDSVSFRSKSKKKSARNILTVNYQ